jgi:transcription termination/antitermination protein NusG
MPFYAIQIWTGDEARFLAVSQKKLDEDVQRLHWPRRSLRIKRAGVWRESLAPIFPGYVFLQAEAVDASLFTLLRAAPGFIRFLLSNENIVPMERKDQDLLSHFLSFGEIVTKSVAYFDENKRIRIVSGPLKDLEGMIVSVDRRKGRARVKLEMYQNSFEVDFGFAALEAASKAPKNGDALPKP